MTQQPRVGVGTSGRLSLGDVRGFLALADKAGLPDGVEIKARVTFGGWLKTLESGEPRNDDRKDPS